MVQDTLLRGVGQVMLQNNALTGLLFLIGIFYNSWIMGLGAMLGVLVSTLVAEIKKEHVDIFNKLRFYDANKKENSIKWVGFRSILNDYERPLIFENIPEKITEEVIAMIYGMTPTEFYEGYVLAADELEIPKKNMLVKIKFLGIKFKKENLVFSS